MTAHGTTIEEDLDDADARTRITEDTTATLFVEAGAGSGKTHSLVQRICHLVLTDGIELDRIAAITFTEKAAAELRERVRVELAGHTSPESERALRQLDTAAIGTLHGFAARIIGEHPLEARVPPRIQVVDAMGSQLSFQRRWQRMQQLLFTDEAPDVVAEAMHILIATGVSVNQIRTLADGLDRNWDRLDPSGQLPDVEDADIGIIVREAESICGCLTDCRDETDNLARQVHLLQELLIPLREATDATGWIPIVAYCPGPGNGGKGANWVGGTAQVKEIKARIKDLRDKLIPGVLNGLLDGALRIVVDYMSGLIREEADERRRTGQLEFHDLLVHAAEVLRESSVAAATHERYQRILLDEFQDTDPLQLKLAQRIVAGAGATDTTGAGAADTTGRLFTVGDPKQSIYRFRRADIAAYMGAREQVPVGDVVQLTTNFRSTRAVIDWVNRVFGRLVQAQGHVQAGYVELAPRPDRPQRATYWGPAPFVFSDNSDPTPDEIGLSKADLPRTREARDVARIIATATEEGWCHEKRRGPRDYDHVPLKWSDICILIPSRAVLPFLEKSLDAAGVEFRSEASSLVYSTQEVHDLLVTCRALANTADSAAIVAALRTPLFCCGDDDLLRWRRAGGRWIIHLDPPDGLADSPVAQAFTYLKGLSREIGGLNPGALLSRLATDRRVFEVSMDSPRHRDVWRRLRFVIDQAHAWYAEDRGSLRDYLDWAATQSDENARVAETVLPEIGVNAVRIMTIHAAKGLQFPMVIVAGMSGGFRTDSEPVLWDSSDALQAYASKAVRTAGYDAADAAEDAHTAAEKVRLLYVACTRAESHLAVSGYMGSRSCWGAILADGLDDTDAVMPELVDARRRDEDTPTGAEPQSWDDWLAETERVADMSARRSSYSATHLAHRETDSAAMLLDSYTAGGLIASGRPTPIAGGTGSKQSGPLLGIALHTVLEAVSLADGTDDAFRETARRIAGEYGLADVDFFVDLACSAIAADPVQHAGMRPHWQEMQLAGIGPDGTTVIEGVADLVYRDDDGALVIVDYKTDVGVKQETLEAYWAQLSIYADLIRQATGEYVSRLELVFCRPGDAVVVSRSFSR